MEIRLRKRQGIQSIINRVALFIVIITGVWLVSCGDSIDNNYLSDNPCSAPCWHNITPGITDELVALDILNSLNFIASNSVRCENSSRYSGRKECVFSTEHGERNRIATSDKIVSFIRITPDYKLTLGEIVEFWGDPQFIVVELDGVEEICARMEGYYARGIIVVAYKCPHNYIPVDVSADMQIDFLMFVEGNEELTKLLTNALYTPSSIPSIIPAVHEWNGFGRYQAK